MSRGYRSRRSTITVTIECPYCNSAFRAYEDEDSARCPSCDQRVRIQDGEAAPVGSCSVHPDAAALGSCRRCGNFLCLTCRTRWYERSYCIECVEFLSEEQVLQATANVKGHRWAAWLSVLFGVVGWFFSVIFMSLLLGISDFAGDNPRAGGGLFFFSVFLAQFSGLGAIGVGQGAAAIRTRGDHLILATIGLVISGLLIGVSAGVILASTVRIF